jgi:hypothetical protein
MAERRNALVRIDATGAAHPVGREASRSMRQRQGGMKLLPSPDQTVLMRAAQLDPSAEDDAPFWLTGEIVRAGVLWDLIGMASSGNWTGELVVIDEDHHRSIFFEHGAVVGATSTAERERLGEVFYHRGVLTEEQIQAAADAVTPDIRFGESAVALGFLSRTRLFELIGNQVEEIVYAVMLVSKGAFYFIEEIDEARLSYRLNLSVPGLLMEGVQRMDELELFRARIPSELYVPEVVAESTLPDDHEHRHVYGYVDGARSVEDIARESGIGIFDATRAIFQLLQGAFVVIHPPRPTGPNAIVTLFNQAISLILQRVDQVGGGAEIREQLSSFATASGVYDALFRDAGPAEDGTLDPDKIAETIMVLVGPENATAMLAQWLYEYASFAMFIAEPLLRSRVVDEGAGPTSEGAAVSRKVADLLAPLAPES